MFLSKNILLCKTINSFSYSAWNPFATQSLRCVVSSSRTDSSTDTPLPIKPKKPAPAFILFMKRTKEELEKKNIRFPKIVELMKQCSMLWKELPEEQRNAWLKDSAERYADYRKKFKEYKSSLTTDQKFQMKYDNRIKVKKKLKIEKDLQQIGLPSKPTSVMGLFSKTLEQANEGEDNKGLMSIITKWKALPEAEKKVYHDIYRVQWAAYVEAKKEWNSDPEKVNIVRNIKKIHSSESLQEVSKMKLDMLGRPKKPRNKYFHFLYMEHAGTKRGKTFFQDKAEEWRNMSDEEKQVYIDASNIDMEKYKKEYDAWMRKMEDEGKIEIVEELLENIKMKPKKDQSHKQGV